MIQLRDAGRKGGPRGPFRGPERTFRDLTALIARPLTPLNLDSHSEPCFVSASAVGNRTASGSSDSKPLPRFDELRCAVAGLLERARVTTPGRRDLMYWSYIIPPLFLADCACQG